jgi:hypothetical protein
MNIWKATTLALLMLLGVVVGGAAVRSASAEKQPHMEKALTSLKDARDQLKMATPDKGGHRVKALELTNAAIEQVEKGIAFDDSHK